MTTRSDPLPLDNLLCFAVYSANIAINRIYRPVLDQLGLTYPQYLVMNVLWEADGQPIGAIADRLSLESSTITPLVKRLETAGLVKRRRNPEDERQVIATLTPRGKALHRESTCIAETLLEKSGLPAADLARLNKEVAGLRDSLVRHLDA